jgi:hypothetical protein
MVAPHSNLYATAPMEKPAPASRRTKSATYDELSSAEYTSRRQQLAKEDAFSSYQRIQDTYIQLSNMRAKHAKNYEKWKKERAEQNAAKKAAEKAEEKAANDERERLANMPLGAPAAFNEDAYAPTGGPQ